MSLAAFNAHRFSRGGSSSVNGCEEIEMRMALAVGSLGVDTLWTQKRDRAGRVLLRILRRVSRQRAESLEVTIARAIDQALVEFAREMAG
jgi:hypothetical protein